MGGGKIRPLIKHLYVWYQALTMPWNKNFNIQQFPGKRKSSVRILWENIVWTFKYKEPCKYYFAYGLDIKGKNPNDYVGYSEFRMMRNILNIRQRENLDTLYTFNYLALTRDKFVFYQYCDSLGIPHPKILALVKHGKISYAGNKKMFAEPLESILAKNIDAFCKEVSGESGKGAFVLEIKDGNIKINNCDSDINDLANRIGDAYFIIQERLFNHKEIDKIYAHSLNTLKLYTFLHDDGTVEYCGAILRFGVNGSIVDNASQGGFFVGVNNGGTLMDEGYFEPGKRKNLVVYGVHPDTNVKFAGIKIPYWDDIVETAKDFHQYFYGVPSIGWDIAITNNGFSFTETGEDWEIPAPQMAYGGLRKEFYRTHGKALKIKLRSY